MRSFCTRSFMLLAAISAVSGCQQDPMSPSDLEAPALAASSAATLFFTQVSAGSNHTCAITPEKRAYCWGENEAGQLGNGTGTSSNKPVPVAGGLRFLQVSAGASFTCGIATNNKAYCWGLNIHGQLGIEAVFSSVPVAVAGGRSFRNIRAGYDHTCAVTPFNVGFCWGKNRFGELGINSTTVRRSAVPVRVAGGLQWQRINAGGHYSCGVTTDQRAYCWGFNDDGNLGDGTQTLRRKPVPVAGGLRFRLIVAGGGGYSDAQFEEAGSAHTCGVTTENKGYCWGRMTATVTPTAIPGTTRRWQQVIAGWEHTCGVTLADVAFCWGYNGSGQNGTGNTTSSNAPVRVAGGHVFTNVTTGVGDPPYGGGAHSCGLTSGNRVYCWGDNQSGQLGDGTRTRRLSPVAVVGP